MSSQRQLKTPLIVGIGGTGRPNSASERAVAEALRSAARLGAEIRLFDGSFVSRLPPYVPERTQRTAAERDFIATTRRCHGVIVATPGHRGNLSAPIKNALDLLEDTARDDNPYLDGRSFGCVVTAHGRQACGATLVALRMIAHALRAWPTPFGVALNASTPLFETDGACADPKIALQLAVVACQVVEFARHRAAGLAADTVVAQPPCESRRRTGVAAR